MSTPPDAHLTHNPEPGMYDNVPYDKYAAWDAARHSMLKNFKRTALHARWSMLHERTPSAALEFGQASHVALLEPDRFHGTYVKAPKLDKRTKAGKADWASFEVRSQKQGLTPIEDSQFAHLEAMGAAVHAHPLAHELLSGHGKNEYTGVWPDETTGLTCKLRLDRLTSLAGFPCVVDLKTAEDASWRMFSKAIANYQYDEQAGMYLDGLATIVKLRGLPPVERKYVFVVVETKEPYGVACYELDAESIAAGTTRYRKHLEMYAECLRTNVWAGYSSNLEPIGLPGWALNG